MDYRKEWCFGGDQRDADIDDFITAYIAENGKRIECKYGWDNLRHGYEVDGEFYGTLREAKAAVEAVRIPSTSPEFGKGLTPDERALVEEYLDFHNSMTLEVYDCGHGTYAIEDESDTYHYMAAATLVAAIRDNLREAYEELAQRADFSEYLDHYYRLTAEDYGEDALVKIHYNREYKTADICLASANEDGEWGAWWATVDADYFTVCDQKRVVDLVLRNSDQGCSVQTSCRSLRELACSERDTDLYDLFQYDVVINPKEVAR